MADMIAAGKLPLWVRFSVREGTRRKNALGQIIILASMGNLTAIAGATLVSPAVFDGSGSGWARLASVWGGFFFSVGILGVGAALWAWLAIRWVDRHRKWEKPA